MVSSFVDERHIQREALRKIDRAFCVALIFRHKSLTTGNYRDFVATPTAIDEILSRIRGT